MNSYSLVDLENSQVEINQNKIDYKTKINDSTVASILQRIKTFMETENLKLNDFRLSRTKRNLLIGVNTELFENLKMECEILQFSQHDAQVKSENFHIARNNYSCRSLAHLHRVESMACSQKEKLIQRNKGLFTERLVEELHPRSGINDFMRIRNAYIWKSHRLAANIVNFPGFRPSHSDLDIPNEIKLDILSLMYTLETVELFCTTKASNTAEYTTDNANSTDNLSDLELLSLKCAGIVGHALQFCRYLWSSYEYMIYGVDSFTLGSIDTTPSNIKPFVPIFPLPYPQPIHNSPTESSMFENVDFLGGGFPSMTQNQTNTSSQSASEVLILMSFYERSLDDILVLVTKTFKALSALLLTPTVCALRHVKGCSSNRTTTLPSTTKTRTRTESDCDIKATDIDTSSWSWGPKYTFNTNKEEINISCFSNTLFLPPEHYSHSNTPDNIFTDEAMCDELTFWLHRIATHRHSLDLSLDITAAIQSTSFGNSNCSPLNPTESFPTVLDKSNSNTCDIDDMNSDAIFDNNDENISSSPYLNKFQELLKKSYELTVKSILYPGSPLMNNILTIAYAFISSSECIVLPKPNKTQLEKISYGFLKSHQFLNLIGLMKNATFLGEISSRKYSFSMKSPHHQSHGLASSQISCSDVAYLEAMDEEISLVFKITGACFQVGIILPCAVAIVDYGLSLSQTRKPSYVLQTAWLAALNAAACCVLQGGDTIDSDERGITMRTVLLPISHLMYIFNTEDLEIATRLASQSFSTALLDNNNDNNNDNDSIGNSTISIETNNKPTKTQSLSAPAARETLMHLLGRRAVIRVLELLNYYRHSQSLTVTHTGLLILRILLRIPFLKRGEIDDIYGISDFVAIDIESRKKLFAYENDDDDDEDKDKDNSDDNDRSMTSLLLEKDQMTFSPSSSSSASTFSAGEDTYSSSLLSSSSAAEAVKVNVDQKSIFRKVKKLKQEIFKDELGVLRGPDSLKLTELVLHLFEVNAKNPKMIEQLLLLVQHLGSSSNVAKLALAEAEIPSMIRRILPMQSSSIYLTALCEICLDVLYIKDMNY